MIKGFIKKSTLLYFIFCVYSTIFLGKYSAFSSVLISPSLTKPTAPGKIGSRQLDWNATDYGELSYQIPIQSPKLRQLAINLAVYYSPANSYSEAGPFWGLNIQKVSLDTRNGDTKFITSNFCSTSKADNLYVNKTKMISIGNGKWASQFNSGRDILQCSNSGFIFYKADGTIYEFGTTFESQISDAQGNAIEWYLTKVKTFQGLQEINYLYEKPLVDTQSINLKMVKNGQISENHFQLYSKPLLKTIQSDDVTIQVNYENTDFVNPHFIGGVYQVINSRIKDISVEKGGNKLKNYRFEYESNIDSPFSRLKSVQEFGNDNTTTFPKTVFSYRSNQFAFEKNVNNIKHATIPNTINLSTNKIKFADMFGTGKTQIITQTGYDNLLVRDYEPENIIDEYSENLKLKSEKKIHVKPFSGALNIANMNFIDFNGSGKLDIFQEVSAKRYSPYIILHSNKINQFGEYEFDKVLKISEQTMNWSNCGNSESGYKLADMDGDGKTDIICVVRGNAYFILNRGINEINERSQQRYEVKSENVKYTLADYSVNSDLHINAVDWNNDGLTDLLQYYNGELIVYLNTGKLARKEFNGKLFEKISLGNYAFAFREAKLKDVSIGDFTGTGLPSIALRGREFLINQGLGKSLTYHSLHNLKSRLNFSAITQFNGSGKLQLLVGTLYENRVFELPIRSFPNLLHSVTTADGRFLSFNYSSTVLENNEASIYETNEEIKQIEKNNPLMPVVLPLLKQTGLSDGFNPTRMWRYSYRVPNFDRSLKKFLGFSLVRKQAVGDATQAGTLIEKRLLSGYRISEQEKIFGIEDNRLTSEKSTFTQEYPSYCLNSNLTTKQTDWCTELAGYVYSVKQGAALNDTSFATGSFQVNENISTKEQKISLQYLSAIMLDGLGTVDENTFAVAAILEDHFKENISGKSYLNYNSISKESFYYYDQYSRLSKKIQKNSFALNGDNLVTDYTYFCPQSHPENPRIFCDFQETTTLSASQGSVKSVVNKIVYHNITGLPLEEYTSNQEGNLVLKATATYDDYGRIKFIKNSNGVTSSVIWNEQNANLISITDQDQLSTYAKYNEIGYLSEITNTRGNISRYNYDPLGRITSIAKNLPGSAPLNKIESNLSKWDIFIQWVKSVFNRNTKSDFSKAFGENNPTEVFEFEKYEYVFPAIKETNGNLDSLIQKWNQFDNLLSINSNPENYNEKNIGKIDKSQLIPGSVSIYRRNNAKEDLSLVSKMWFSGMDEALFIATKIDNERYSVVNKSSLNTLGKIYKDYLNSEMLISDILSNSLPNEQNFKVKSINKYYADGSVLSHEYDTDVIQTFIQGVDYSESISPEGRRTKQVFNDIGQIQTKYLGLDKNGNISSETLITNIFYDAFQRIQKVTNNDGLLASQTFGANNLVESQINNALGVSRFFYDDNDRIKQSLLCSIETQVESCNNLATSILAKEYFYNTTGKLEKEEHTRFNRSNSTNAKETIQYEYGSLAKNSRSQDIGLAVGISVYSKHELGTSESIRRLAYNQEGSIASEDLELFLIHKTSSNTQNKKSLGVYQFEKLIDLAGNTTQIRSRGGFSREKLNSLKESYFTGYLAEYEQGTNLVKHLEFIQDGVSKSVPLQSTKFDSQGFIKEINLENNLQLLSCWHQRKEVPLAFWAGNKNLAPNNLCENNNSESGLFHSKWTYDNDLFPIEAKDFSSFKTKDPALSLNSKFVYDSQGRLVSTSGLGDEHSAWGSIQYYYSVGGKINKVTRSGKFIQNRISDKAKYLEDIYAYSDSGQIGVLKSVTSSDGVTAAIQNFQSDNIGYRQSGVVPSLAVLANGTRSKDNTNATEQSSTWANEKEIPMQKYVWNGRGQLAGTFAASIDEKQKLVTGELLNFKMSDELGYQLAEFDGVTFQKITRENELGSEEELTVNKLARTVSFSNGISFERDEIHFNIGIGSFANLKLITRYPTLNASNPESLTSSYMQTRKELVVKDHVSSVSVVIDIDTLKIVERNASEPFGLGRGIPLLVNSALENYKAEGKRKDVSLYTNAESNMREEWEAKSFELLGTRNSNELQGMRGAEVFAKGKFSHSTGLDSMGVRTYDPARGMWLSPDLFMGRNLEEIVKSPIEANLFQYAKNNPIVNNDPTGMLSWDGLKSKFKDAASGKVGGGGHDMTKNPGSGGGLGGKNDNSSSRQNDIQGVEKANLNSNSWFNDFNNSAKSYGYDLGSMASRINSAISSPEMGMCAGLAAGGLSALVIGGLLTGSSILAAPPTSGASLLATPSSASMTGAGLGTATLGLGCMTGILYNAATGSPGDPKKPSNKECSYSDPRNLQDQMVMDAVKKGQFIFETNISAGIRVDKVPITLNDARYLGMQKMQIKVESSKGLVTNIHYNQDKNGIKHDIKFKGPCL